MMDSSVCDFLQKYNILNAEKHLVGMDFDGLMQLQPHHLKMLIPNLDERISFQSLLFKAITKERESLNANSENDVINTPINNSVQFDSTYTVELVEDKKSVNESEIATSNVVFKIVPSEITINPTTNYDKSGKENIADKDDEVKIAGQGDEGKIDDGNDKFHLSAIDDIEFEIIVNKYARLKVFEASDRLDLARCVIKHCLKLDVKKQLDRYDFENLTGIIIRMFPTELKESYYIPGHDKIPSKLKLYKQLKTF